MISSTLVTCQIDKRYLGKYLFMVLETDLKNGMRAGRVSVGGILRGDSKGAAEFDDVHELVSAADHLLFHPNHVYVLILVLAKRELRTVIQKIVQLLAVDFVEGYSHVKVRVLWLN